MAIEIPVGAGLGSVYKEEIDFQNQHSLGSGGCI